MKTIRHWLHYFFIPSDKNNFRAKALHVNVLTYYLVLIVFLTFSHKYTNSPIGNVLGFATDITSSRLLEFTNNERSKYGLSNLTYNDKLAAAARKKAEDMFALNYWSHYGPKGQTPWDFMLGAGYQYSFAGENLAKNFNVSQSVVDAWMSSPSHKENIMRKEYQEVGFAVVNGVLNGEETTLVVQMFGTPLNQEVAKQEEVKPQFPVARVLAEEKKEPIAISSIPSQVPTLTSAPVSSHSTSVLSNYMPPKKTLNLFNVNVNMSIIFVLFVMVSLALDYYFSTKVRMLRITGKNAAHFIFLGFIFVSLIIFTKGAIL